MEKRIFDKKSHIIDGRRAFVYQFGVASMACLLAQFAPINPALADSGKLPKPENVINPDKAMERLLSGNERYVNGVARRHDFSRERDALVGSQNPYAAILGCADSRVSPEYAFDSGRGDLFVVRVAGNYVNDGVIGSLEYSVYKLGVPLLLVLGHDRCGAIGAAIKVEEGREKYPNKIQGISETLVPAVKAARALPGDLMSNSVKCNVLNSVARLKAESKIISNAVAAGRLSVVGAVYRLSSGRVEIVG